MNERTELRNIDEVVSKTKNICLKKIRDSENSSSPDHGNLILVQHIYYNESPQVMNNQLLHINFMRSLQSIQGGDKRLFKNMSNEPMYGKVRFI